MISLHKSRKFVAIGGVFFAFFASITAAAAHTVMGANLPTLFSVFAAAVFSAPLAMFALSRKQRSFPLLCAVLLIQGLYHWLFKYLDFVTPNAEHLGGSHVHGAALLADLHTGVVGFSVTTSGLHTSGLLMLVGHLLAALSTFALLRSAHGAVEKLLLAVIRKLRWLWSTISLSPGYTLPQVRISSAVCQLSGFVAASTFLRRGPPLPSI